MELSEQIIIQEIRKGNSSVYESLFNNYYPPLKQFAFRFLYDEAACKDVIQDVFTVLWDKRQEIAISSLKSYLYTAVKNKCLTQIRNLGIKDKHQVMLVDAYLTTQEEADIDEPELHQQVKEALNQLPTEMKRIFRLKYVHGLSMAEIAEDLDISVSTVKTQLSRARQKLRQLLFEHTYLIFLL